jgi:hypothetical protein
MTVSSQQKSMKGVYKQVDQTKFLLFPRGEFRCSKATQPLVARQLHIPGNIRL